MDMLCCRLGFLSINRFERKKNIDLAISAFAMLHTLQGDVLHGHNVADATLTVSGKSLCLFLALVQSSLNSLHFGLGIFLLMWYTACWYHV